MSREFNSKSLPRRSASTGGILQSIEAPTLEAPPPTAAGASAGPTGGIPGRLRQSSYSYAGHSRPGGRALLPSDARTLPSPAHTPSPAQSPLLSSELTRVAAFSAPNLSSLSTALCNSDKCRPTTPTLSLNTLAFAPFSGGSESATAGGEGLPAEGSSIKDLDAMSNTNALQSIEIMFTEAQRIAYAALVYLLVLRGFSNFDTMLYQSVHTAARSYKQWSQRLTRTLYKRLGVKAEDTKAIESLAKHAVCAKDLASSLHTKHEEPNVEPENSQVSPKDNTDSSQSDSITKAASNSKITDLRFILLRDFYAMVVAESAYDARSRAMLHDLAEALGVPESETLALQSLRLTFHNAPETSATSLEAQQRADRRRRILAVTAATIGGGLIVGISAGLAAPFIGAGLGAAFTGIGISGTTAFLSGVGGTSLITTGATLAGSGIAAQKMAKRTQGVTDLRFLPMETPIARAMNVVISVGGWIASLDEMDEEISMPFSVLDPSYGEHYSVLWEPAMLRELGSLLTMIASEVITTAVQQALMATMLGGLLAGLAWPLALSKIGYLIDNPWQIALSRSSKAGKVIAYQLAVDRIADVRPVTLIGYSLGARVIFYALLELSRMHAYGIVQDVILLGCPVAPTGEEWQRARSVVAGKLVNAYLLNDWVLGFLFRATTGGFRRVAGLGPANACGVQDVDMTSTVGGHMKWRLSVPRVLGEILGLPLRPGTDYDFLVVRDEDTERRQDERAAHDADTQRAAAAAARRRKTAEAVTTDYYRRMALEVKAQAAQAGLKEAAEADIEEIIEALKSVSLRAAKETEKNDQNDAFTSPSQQTNSDPTCEPTTEAPKTEAESQSSSTTSPKS